MAKLVRFHAAALVLAAVVSTLGARLSTAQDIASEPTRAVREAPAPGDDSARVSVVVAEVDLEPYERILDAKMVKRVKYPESLMPRYSALDVKDVVGRLPTAAIYRGEIVSLARLIDKDELGKPLTVAVHGAWCLDPPTAPEEPLQLVAVYDAELPGAPGRTVKVARVVATQLRLLRRGAPDRDTRLVTVWTPPREAATVRHLALMGATSFHLVRGFPASIPGVRLATGVAAVAAQ